MKGRTILIAASAALVAVVLVLRSWAGGDAAPAARPAPIPAATGAAAAGAAPRVVVVRDGETARVRSELAELRAEVDRLSAPPAPAEKLSREERQARDAQLAAAQGALLEKTLAADSRDPSWSPQSERALREAFAAAALPGARLDEVTCSATLCRFTVAFASIDQRDEGMAAASGLVPWDSVGFGNFAPGDPLRYVVYASRDPSRFPTVP